MKKNKAPTVNQDGRETSAGSGNVFSNRNSRTLTIAPQYSESTNTPRPIFVGGRMVGEVADGVFEKRVKASNHFLRSPRAIAFSLASLHEAERLGATWVLVIDTESGKTYRASFGAIRQYGREMERGGFERQIFLTLDRWTVNGGQSGEQLALFFGETEA